MYAELQRRKEEEQKKLMKEREMKQKKQKESQDERVQMKQKLEEERKKMKEDIRKKMQSNRGGKDGLKVEIVGIPGEMLQQENQIDDQDASPQ